ncbi:hypothetical protein QE152_g39766 [Popillia japonica]|uniref:Uncharacterized protein n=1 Tax=Popillia japonica TaxID=7064 RepID=A0AAW1HT84_POPJA
MYLKAFNKHELSRLCVVLSYLPPYRCVCCCPSKRTTNGLSGTSPLNIGILPPNNACDELTNEDSGEEDFVSVNNLPPSQLLANAEIINADVGESDSDSNPEYNTPLARLRKQVVLPKKIYKWKNGDIQKRQVIWPVVQTAMTNRTPFELFSLFLDKDVISNDK